MSLRSYRDQAQREDDWAAMTPAQRAAEDNAARLPKEKVRDAVECRMHVATIGTYCQKFAGAFHVCASRRRHASYTLAGVEMP
jgi:hypothetical protein